MTLSFTTIVKRVNDKDETGLGGEEESGQDEGGVFFSEFDFRFVSLRRRFSTAHQKKGGRILAMSVGTIF